METITKEYLTRLNAGSMLLNAKIELSKAINMLDQLYEDGKAELSECGKLYEIKNMLREYIDNYRLETIKRDHEKEDK